MKKGSVSIKLIWMGAYFAVILLMCLVFFVGTIMVTRTVEKHILQTNEETATFMQKSLDDNWRSVLEYSTQILTNTRAAELNKTIDRSEFIAKDTYEFVTNFRYLVQANRLVEEAHMYFPAQDYVVGTKGTYASHAYWASMYGATREYEYDAWMELMFGNTNMGYFAVQNGNDLDLYYRISVFSENGRILVAKINTAVLEDTLRWICEDTENNFLAMVDESGKVCAYSGNSERFVDGQTNLLLPVDEENYLYTERVSGITTLCYVAIKEMNQAYHQSNAIQNIALIFLVFAFVSGVCVAVFMAMRNAKPVQQLAEKFKGSEAVSGNELHYISRQVDDLMQDNKNALDALARQQNRMIGRAFLNECLKFTQADSRDVETIAAICGISLENRYCTVLVRERSGQDYSSNMIAVLDALENEDDLIIWTQKQDLDVLLLNYDDERIVEQAEYALRQHSGESSKVVKSKPSGSTEDIRTSYLDCLRQLRRKEVVLMPHTAEPKKEFEDLKGKSILGSFQKYLSDGDFSGARQLVPELRHNYLNGAEPLERACSRYAIVQQFLNLKNTMDIRRQLIELAREEDNARFESRLYELLTQCSRWKLMYQESDNDIAGKARCIVDEMYSDPLLSLRMISDEVGISQSYVSRMFKKKYGIGIAQYINQVRIDNAKKLIRNGSANIKAISLQVGFSSDVQFIRVFKKLEGVTPGTFRLEGAAEE